MAQTTRRQGRRFGSVRQLPSGRYQARWKGPDAFWHNAPTTYATRDEAETWLARQRVDRAEGNWIDERDGTIPLRTVAETWGENLGHLRPSTSTRDLDYLRRYILKDPIAERPVGTLAPSELDAWVNRMRKRGLAPATIRKAAQILGSIFDVALRDRNRAGENPARSLKLPKVEDEEMNILAPAGIRRLADAIKPHYRALVIFACYTGLRIGELAALTAGDVDLIRGTVRVTRNVVEVSGHLHHGPVKTKAGRRTVPLAPRAIETVTPLVAAAKHPDDILFPNSRGGFLRASTFRSKFFDPATEAIGMPELRPHDMRHTAVSMWVAAGIDLKSVAVWAGHRSVATVIDRYGHLQPDQHGAAMARLDAFAEAHDPHPPATVTPIRPPKPADTDPR